MNSKKADNTPFAILRYTVPVLCNFIPLFGHLVLGWDITEIILFYALELTMYELVMQPAFFIYASQMADRDGKNLFGKIRYSFYMLVGRSTWFIMAQMFILHAAFAFSAAAGAEPTAPAVLSFLETNIFAIVILCAEYIFAFIITFVKNREHVKLSPDFYGVEYFGYPIIFLTAIGIVNGAGVLLKLDAPEYKLLILILVIGLKSAGQILMQRRKNRELREAANRIRPAYREGNESAAEEITLQISINGKNFPYTLRKPDSGGVLPHHPGCGGKRGTGPPPSRAGRLAQAPAQGLPRHHAHLEYSMGIRSGHRYEGD